MAVPDGKPVDFEILKEPWNKYELKDGSTLKTRFILKKVLVKNLSESKANFGFDGQNLSVIMCDDDWKGEPDKKAYSTVDLKNALEKEIRYDTLLEEWNEYLVDDGTRIRLKTTVTNVNRTTLYDNTGDRIYLVETNVMMNIKRPKPLDNN